MSCILIGFWRMEEREIWQQENVAVISGRAYGKRSQSLALLCGHFSEMLLRRHRQAVDKASRVMQQTLVVFVAMQRKTMLVFRIHQEVFPRAFPKNQCALASTFIHL